MEDEKDTEEVKGVSLIYLSRNGAEYIEKKLNFLLQELSVFKQYELIVIDDGSTDESKRILHKFQPGENLRIIMQVEQRGIPHSMNTGVRLANFEVIIFCDQRQQLSENAIKRLVDPLRFINIGAVSACISNVDKENRFSLMRKHENFIKSQEGRSGNLMGVYGPLYAIRKKSYSEIPDSIILDDLYLTLRILRSNQVRFIKECRVFDEDPFILYNYSRIQRYLSGFLQLLTLQDLIKPLKRRQIIMLFWHKYSRLLIPLLLFSNYLCLGIMSFNHLEYLLLFILSTVLIFVSVFQGTLKSNFILLNIIRVSMFYFLSFMQIIIRLFHVSMFSNNSVFIRGSYNKME